MIEYELFEYNKHLLKTHVYCGCVFKSLKWEDDGTNWRWSISPMYKALWASNANDRNVTCKMVWTEMLEVGTLSQGMLIFQYVNKTAVTTYKESSLWLCNKCSFLLCRGWGYQFPSRKRLYQHWWTISWHCDYLTIPALVELLGGRWIVPNLPTKHNWVSPHPWATASFSKVDWLLGDYEACCYWLLFLKTELLGISSLLAHCFHFSKVGWLVVNYET